MFILEQMRHAFAWLGALPGGNRRKQWARSLAAVWTVITFALLYWLITRQYDGQLHGEAFALM